MTHPEFVALMVDEEWSKEQADKLWKRKPIPDSEVEAEAVKAAARHPILRAIHGLEPVKDEVN